MLFMLPVALEETGSTVVNVPFVSLVADLIRRCHEHGLDATQWQMPPIFRLIQRLGGVSDEEMHHVFNMGIGMTLIVAPDQVDEVSSRLSSAACPASVIGRVVEGERAVRLVGR